MSDGTFQPRTYSDILTRWILNQFIDPAAGIYARVQGIDADGGPVTVDPVVIGGVDGTGNVQQIATDTSGNQVVVGPTAADSPSTTNPVQIGAKYVADIFATVLSATGDVAALVTDQFQRLWVRNPAYDSVSDADRAVIASSLAEPAFQDMSQTTSVAGNSNNTGIANTYEYFLDMDDYEYAAVQLYSTAGTSVKSLNFAATCQDDGTALASCVYSSESTDWFGAAAFAIAAGVQTDTWPIFDLDAPVTVKGIRVRMVLDGSVTADNQWVMYARKRRV